ncbi:MAG: type II toxin-antitoxin system VapC family toxin [Marmoricola sp.]
MIVLDASVLIGYLDGNDAHHAAAEELLTAVLDEDLAVNPLTLAEILVAPARDGRVDLVMDVLRELEVEELAFPSDAAPRLARLRVATGLKMPDCCVLLSADVANAGIASFDDQLLQAAERRGLPVTRAELTAISASSASSLARSARCVSDAASPLPHATTR